MHVCAEQRHVCGERLVASKETSSVCSMPIVEHLDTGQRGSGVKEAAHLGSAQPHGSQQVCSCVAAVGGPALRCPQGRAQGAWQQCRTAPCLHLECLGYLQEMLDISAIQQHAQLVPYMTDIAKHAPFRCCYKLPLTGMPELHAQQCMKAAGEHAALISPCLSVLPATPGLTGLTHTQSSAAYTTD